MKWFYLIFVRFCVKINNYKVIWRQDYYKGKQIESKAASRLLQYKTKAKHFKEHSWTLLEAKEINHVKTYVVNFLGVNIFACGQNCVCSFTEKEIQIKNLVQFVVFKLRPSYYRMRKISFNAN